MAEIKPSLELYYWSKDEPPSYNQSDFTGFWKNPKYGPNMAQKRFFDNISGTKSPRTKIFALLGSSYMTGSGWHPISIFLEISAGRICWATESRLLNLKKGISYFSTCRAENNWNGPGTKYITEGPLFKAVWSGSLHLKWLWMLLSYTRIYVSTSFFQ